MLRLDTLTGRRTDAPGPRRRDPRQDEVHPGRVRAATELVIPWGPDVRGPYAAEQSMARKPMKEHETRSLKMFMPDSEQDLRHRLHAGLETVVLGDGTSAALARRADDPARRQAKARVRRHALGRPRRPGPQTGTGYSRRLVSSTARPRKPRFSRRADPVRPDQRHGDQGDARDPERRKKRARQVPPDVQGGDLSQVIPATRGKASSRRPTSRRRSWRSKAWGLDGAAGPAEVDPQYLKPNALVTSDDSRVGAWRSRRRGASTPGKKPCASSIGSIRT